ncbi:LysR family transcriptional regulator [Sphingomonas paeninsulae]|jgi:DNA-binding transcriptional LysR family regulator|uniref:LysR family transcriptional regulator n=1 Tax=Sphingomonas paeninsulae TaxID=2319844 RepID=A0A494TA23_SPHPE|nr:LysR family transcriptional regulator [Sphingomonas paeninsulae]AYJ85830.1 LysR family transcriptional regulator [Sphingomonas paeninsulae]
MISRSQIRQFLAVVDTGNFTRAATQINVTQPTLSAGIAELEKRLGSKLFERSSRRVELTPAGNQLLRHARAVEREFRQAEAGIPDRSIAVKIIRLGVLTSFATRLLESALSSYQGVERVEIMEGNERELTSALSQDRIDAAVTILHAGDSRFTQTSLNVERYCLAMSDSHPLAGREVVAADEIADEPMIARRSCEMLARTSRHFTERGVRPPFSFRSVNDDRAMALVRAGAGITVAPESHGGPGIAMPILEGFTETREVGLCFTAHCIDQFGTEHPLFQRFRHI